jgi:hypothetical protein
VKGKTVTGFANVEEDFADDAVWGMGALPEGQAPHAVAHRGRARAKLGRELRAPSGHVARGRRWLRSWIRDGNLITGQQNFSGTETANLIIETLGPLRERARAPPRAHDAPVGAHGSGRGALAAARVGRPSQAPQGAAATARVSARAPGTAPIPTFPSCAASRNAAAQGRSASVSASVRAARWSAESSTPWARSHGRAGSTLATGWSRSARALSVTRCARRSTVSSRTTTSPLAARRSRSLEIAPRVNRSLPQARWD